jgi:MFS family permease
VLADGGEDVSDERQRRLVAVAAGGVLDVPGLRDAVQLILSRRHRRIVSSGGDENENGAGERSQVHDLLLFYLVWIGIGLAMACVLYEAAFTVVTKWSRVRRRQALRAVTLMGGFASFVFSPLSNRLIDGQGWRSALVTLAVVLAAATVPLHGVFLRRAPEQAEPSAPALVPGDPPAVLRERQVAAAAAIGSSAFWYLTARRRAGGARGDNRRPRRDRRRLPVRDGQRNGQEHARSGDSPGLATMLWRTLRLVRRSGESVSAGLLTSCLLQQGRDRRLGRGRSCLGCSQSLGYVLQACCSGR